ncbi:ABC transporter substrate-binding protein [Campylobacter canadensis]|uniref:ABC transporter substrate-binding protein n=1 Tax=Campylobacter canadensis TaxID=449520 RepID=A0ABS7WQE4_9BACT|nr:ABC transporter substrate-binding protein [Campylobacter canadensis]MBZ7986987.1 ABC transporter substrate-binding protein [Campylobacter canadensis]MBZ7998023.1 ABC transporter substrate-binding protein [Campylobacter canadensis]
MRNFIIALCCIFSINLFAKSIEVTDVLDRKVTLNLPAKRIVLGFYYTDYLAVGGVKSLDNVVGFSKEVWTDWTPTSWDLYLKALPQLDKLADVGEVELSTFSVEKVLSLKPDLLILAAWQYEIIKDELDVITKAKIPIVVLDYNRESVQRHVKSTELLGLITGEEKRAKELINFYVSTVENVEKRIKAANVKKPKIYIEFGNVGPQEQGNTFGKDMWGSLIDLAQGDNIALPYVEKWLPISNEQVITSNPDVIIIAGRETELKKNKDAMVMGIGIDKDEANKRLKAYLNRDGYKFINAVKNNRVYGIYQGASRTLADAAMVEFIAKALYPDLFRDVDPVKTYIDFHKKYLPVVPTGTFAFQVY